MTTTLAYEIPECIAEKIMLMKIQLEAHPNAVSIAQNIYERYFKKVPYWVDDDECVEYFSNCVRKSFEGDDITLTDKICREAFECKSKYY